MVQASGHNVDLASRSSIPSIATLHLRAMVNARPHQNNCPKQ
jgi:hypothetical protein